MDEMQEIIRDFIEETTDLLECVNTDIMDLEENVSDSEIINRIYRAFHSVKGNSSMLKFTHLENFAHKTEDLFALVRSGKLAVTREISDLLLSIVDWMHLVLADIGENGSDHRAAGAILQVLIKTIDKYEVGKAESKPEKSTFVEIKQGETTLDSEHQPDESVPYEEKKQPEELSSPKQPVQLTNSEPKCRAGEPLKILIVEDDFTSRQLLSSYLSRYGTCHIAKNGLEAVSAVTISFEQKPLQLDDLICMDIMMPEMDGTQATKVIREMERARGTIGVETETIIVMTSAIDDAKTIIKSCYECGANYYFVKPLDFNQMGRQLKKMGLIDSSSHVS